MLRLSTTFQVANEEGGEADDETTDPGPPVEDVIVESRVQSRD